MSELEGHCSDDGFPEGNPARLLIGDGMGPRSPIASALQDFPGALEERSQRFESRIGDEESLHLDQPEGPLPESQIRANAYEERLDSDALNRNLTLPESTSSSPESLP